MIRLRCPRPPASRLTFSPGGDVLGAVGESELWCWCRSLGWELRGLHLSGSSSGLAFHPSGRLLAYAGFPPTESGRPHPRWAGPLGTWGAHFYPLAADGVVEPAALHMIEGEGTPLDVLTVVRFPALAFTPDG